MLTLPCSMFLKNKEELSIALVIYFEHRRKIFYLYQHDKENIILELSIKYEYETIFFYSVMNFDESPSEDEQNIRVRTNLLYPQKKTYSLNRLSLSSTAEQII